MREGEPCPECGAIGCLHFPYGLFRDDEVVYYGTTAEERLEAREGEHRRSGKEFDVLEPITEPLAKAEALAVERESIAEHMARHGEPPEYNVRQRGKRRGSDVGAKFALALLGLLGILGGTYVDRKMSTPARPGPRRRARRPDLPGASTHGITLPPGTDVRTFLRSRARRRALKRVQDLTGVGRPGTPYGRRAHNRVVIGRIDGVAFADEHDFDDEFDSDE